jgi:hypothetical protein
MYGRLYCYVGDERLVALPSDNCVVKGFSSLDFGWLSGRSLRGN